MRKRKVVEVEQPAVVKTPKILVALKDQPIPVAAFQEGDKVRYMSAYGAVKTPPEWEPQPYRVLSQILQYQWQNDMTFAYLYRLRRWTGSVERLGWSAWQTVTAWESQLEPWPIIVEAVDAQKEGEDHA